MGDEIRKASFMIRLEHDALLLSRHCERSEAIQSREKGLDCFVAALLAMTHFDLIHHTPAIP
jgi:hypothetical protein